MKNWHRALDFGALMPYNTLIHKEGGCMNYLCLVDGLVEYASTDPASFAHYQLVYAEEHRDADVQYLAITDETYDKMFPYEEDEE